MDNLALSEVSQKLGVSPHEVVAAVKGGQLERARAREKREREWVERERVREVEIGGRVREREGRERERGMGEEGKRCQPDV